MLPVGGGINTYRIRSKHLIIAGKILSKARFRSIWYVHLMLLVGQTHFQWYIIGLDAGGFVGGGFVKSQVGFYLVGHLMLPVDVYSCPYQGSILRSMQGWFCKVGFYLVHLMLPV